MSNKIIFNEIPVVILSGGVGIRMGKDEGFIPKSMVEINKHPLLFYIMSHYGASGFKRFIICGGHRIDTIKKYVVRIKKDYPVSLDWRIEVINTGVENMTGSRVAQIRERIGKCPVFCLTYGDTISDVNLQELLSFHSNQKKMGTLVAVHPSIRFRILGLYGDEDTIRGFSAKPILQNDFINGGYYVFNSTIFNLDSLKTDSKCILETGVLEDIVSQNELCAYRHTGFWQNLDTERDREKISEWLNKVDQLKRKQNATCLKKG
ncbi:MAG: sugar phosphate nucleotidyltransferase [Candidatus Omnitrophica bacterium]|nr:sugar phosphate nucleotidyltransferase [Candidatus Omnitrophota bacterium]